jgi:ATP-binding cassette, subfamily C (CFTR/MRP), member 1
MNLKINEHLSFYYAEIFSQRWLSIMLEGLSSLLVLFAGIFVVVAKDSISGGTAGLSLSYALSISVNLTLIVRFISEYESSITSVERINEYCQIKEHEVIFSFQLFSK